MKYIVIDVDGVLNCFRFTDTVNQFRTTGHTSDGNTWPLILDKRHAKWLTDLAEETDSTLIWGTTWQDDANSQIGAQIGLPEIYSPDFGLRKFSQENHDWKVRGVLKYVKDSPFVWFDDDPYIKLSIAGFGHDISKQKHIFVEPTVGLTEDHINTAREFLEEF